MPKHGRITSNGNGNGGTPDWAYWTLIAVVLVIAFLILIFGL